jgi:hypothetical protein
MTFAKRCRKSGKGRIEGLIFERFRSPVGFVEQVHLSYEATVRPSSSSKEQLACEPRFY